MDTNATDTFTTDPEHYQDRDNCLGIPTETLREAYRNAAATYATCGGHWRAARMAHAMKSISAELAGRGLDVTGEHVGA